MLQHNINMIIFGYILAYWQFTSAASANTELSKTRDCTEIELEAMIDQDASREDNLARLSQQFSQSVNTVEHCDREQHNVDAASSTKSDSASSSADADRANAASDASAAANSTANTDPASASSEQMTALSDSENPTNISADNSATDSSSTASGSLVGTYLDQTAMTEPAPTFAAPSASNMAGTTPQPTSSENITGAQAKATEQDLRLTNEETPDDIPDWDNDSAFEAQIRAAAMAETDPVTKKNLWNEYRRYKGLPEQK